MPSGMLCSVAETSSVVFFQLLLKPPAVSVPDADAEEDDQGKQKDTAATKPIAAGTQPINPIASAHIAGINATNRSCHHDPGSKAKSFLDIPLFHF
ncbi:MAG: hypothetical protein ACLSA6_16490 [Holdemania massiliensis]